jgi:hypothetical protein
MLDGSLARVRLAHELLDRAAAVAMLFAQQLSDGPRVDFASAKNACP